MIDTFQIQICLHSGRDTGTKPEHLIVSTAMVRGQISQLLEALSSICVEEERTHTTACCEGQKPGCTCIVLSLGGHSSHCTAVLAAFHGPSDPWTCGLQALWPQSGKQVKVRICELRS